MEPKEKEKLQVIAVRLFEVAILLIAAGLVGLGKGICITVELNSTSATDCSFPNADILSWKNAKDVNLGKIRGQYFVFAISILLSLLCIASLILMFLRQKRSKTFELGVTCIAVVGCFAGGCLEAWYASDHGVLIEKDLLLQKCSGATQNCRIRAVVKTWVAAAVLYFLGMITLIVDTVLTAKIKKQESWKERNTRGNNPETYF